MSRPSNRVEEAVARLDAVRRGFAIRLTLRLDALRSLVESARAGDREALGEARAETHRLVGTAGSFGYVEASRQAAVLEALLAAEAWNDAAWAAMLAALAAARPAV